MSSGKYGISMQGIEYRPRKKGYHCNTCAYFTLNTYNAKAPYICSLRNKPLYYTSVCSCRKYRKKGKV